MGSEWTITNIVGISEVRVSLLIILRWMFPGTVLDVGLVLGEAGMESVVIKMITRFECDTTKQGGTEDKRPVERTIGKTSRFHGMQHRRGFARKGEECV